MVIQRTARRTTLAVQTPPDGGNIHKISHLRGNMRRLTVERRAGTPVEGRVGDPGGTSPKEGRT
jgi:hypothetical protein